MKKIVLVLLVLLPFMMAVSWAGDCKECGWRDGERPIPELPTKREARSIPACKLLPEGCEDPEEPSSNYGVCGEFNLSGTQCEESTWTFEEYPALYGEFCEQFPNQHTGCE